MGSSASLRCRLVSAARLLLGLYAVFSATAQPVQAQSCPALQLTGLSSAQNSCAANCCSAYTSCYTADKCSSWEWPKAERDECAVCNQQFLACTGFCLTEPEFQERYLELQSVPDCQPDCGALTPRESLTCGVSDGCGGVCTGASLCGLMRRRPELFPILF